MLHKDIHYDLVIILHVFKGVREDIIHKKDLKKIFDCFYQVELNDKNIVYPGSGIGLYLVKSLVELHKGHISVESE